MGLRGAFLEERLKRDWTGGYLVRHKCTGNARLELRLTGRFDAGRRPPWQTHHGETDHSRGENQHCA